MPANFTPAVLDKTLLSKGFRYRGTDFACQGIFREEGNVFGDKGLCGI